MPLVRLPTGPAPRVRRRREGGERAAAPRIALRLAIGRDGIGLELASPATLDCLVVTELAATLPGVRFPVDVSGGVARFRHRRGDLLLLQIEVPRVALVRWAAPRLRGLLGPFAPEVWLRAEPAKAVVCVTASADAETDGFRIPAVVAFDVHALAEGDDLFLMVTNARGVELPAPATAMAIAGMEALLGSLAERAGCSFVLRGVATALTRALLPEAGARAPSTQEVSWTALAADGDAWILHASRGALSAEPSENALQAREIASVLREADDALVTGDLVLARTRCMEALDRAPRHAEVVRRIVEIDARMPDRAEAALAAIAEARDVQGSPALGIVRGELLARVGDVDAALAAFERAAEAEPAPALAARAYELAARAASDREDSTRWLDRALARAPRATSARWARVTARLALGRLEDALADVEHLEALASGGRGKHAVWLRAGQAWSAAGLGARTAAVFERALRHAPDEPFALAGLGAALVAEGRAARGASVLARALELAQARRLPTSGIALQLARALAEHLDDLPTAVAHVSAIPADAAEAPLARGLEGRWRARLGDLVGAALAFARLRDTASGLSQSLDEERARPIVELLREGADLESRRRHDALAAQRHLAAALHLRPNDPETRMAYRDIGTLILRGGEDDAPEELPAEASPGGDLAAMLGALPPEEDAERASRAEELTRRLQLDPGDDAVADELISLLESLGRGHELLALLSARLEDAGAERRAVLAPIARGAMERLATTAHAEGRTGEAALFRDAAATLAR